MSNSKQPESKSSIKAHLEFERRLALVAKEAALIRRALKVWGVLTTVGALSSILLLILFLLFKLQRGF